MADPDDLEDAQLLAAVSRGDDSAFAVIYRRYLPLAGLRAPRSQRFAAPSRVANAWTGPSRFARSSM
jgi:hypothetical protein